MLSPLSWWNDLFFNLPIALLFGGSVAKTDGGLVEVAFVSTAHSPPHLVHESEAPVQMAAL